MATRLTAGVLQMSSLHGGISLFVRDAVATMARERRFGLLA